MDTQKTVNLLKGFDNENAKFAIKNGMLMILNPEVIIHRMIQ